MVQSGCQTGRTDGGIWAGEILGVGGGADQLFGDICGLRGQAGISIMSAASPCSCQALTRQAMWGVGWGRHVRTFDFFILEKETHIKGQVHEMRNAVPFGTDQEDF